LVITTNLESYIIIIAVKDKLFDKKGQYYTVKTNFRNAFVSVFIIYFKGVLMHFVVIKLSSIKLFCAMLLVLIILSVGANNSTAASVFFGGDIRRVPIYRVETDEKQLAISFDATWGADKTEDILKLLKEYDVDATFFLAGFWIDNYPDMVKKIHEAGVEIGSHSQTHPNMCNLSKEQIKEELLLPGESIKAITRQEVTLFRPPFGAYNNTLINTAEDLGLKTIQWDVDSLDWKGLSATDITTRVLNLVKPGSIVLFHNAATNIVPALRLVLDRLTKRGYKITSIGNLLIKDNYYIDSSGMQRKK
jgi:peptidoglycan-N-acetylglucosamine deacetylase